MTATSRKTTSGPASFDAAEAALQFEQRALAAIHHAAGYGLLTPSEVSSLVDRVHVLTVEAFARPR